MNQKIQALLAGKGGNYVFPFFWQHGECEQTLRQYMEIIQRSNIQAVCIESRPHPDFCGDGWWHDLDIILDEARKRNMKVWILDDSHFPTGYANGAMSSQPDALCRQSLCCKTYTVAGGQALHLVGEALLHPVPFPKNAAEQRLMTEPQRTFSDDRLFAVCAWEKNTKELKNLFPFIAGDHLAWVAPEGNWTILYYIFPGITATTAPTSI